MATTRSNVWAVDGLDATLRVLRSMDKEGQRELRAEVQKITDRHARALQGAAARHRDARVRGLAPTIRAAKDRVPVINVGGARRVPVSGNPQAGQVLFGTEFGAAPSGRNAWRFPTHDAWLYPTLEGRHNQLVKEWERAVADVADRWRR